MKKNFSDTHFPETYMNNAALCPDKYDARSNLRASIGVFLVALIAVLLYNIVCVTASYAIADDTAFTLTALAACGVSFISVPVLYCKINGISFGALGFISRHALIEYLIGASGGFTALLSVWIICILTGSISPAGLSDPVDIASILVFFVCFLIQGLGEEVLCRGLLMNILSRRFGILPAVLISSVIFSLLHLGNDSVSAVALINIFLFGILMSLVILRHGNIWLAAAFHSLWNFSQGNLFGINVSGTIPLPTVFMSVPDDTMSLVNGGAFGLEGGIVTTFVLFTGIVIAFLSRSRKSELVPRGYISFM